MKNYICNVAINFGVLIVTAALLALAAWAVGRTELNPPHVGGPGDYLSLAIGVWLVGVALSADRVMDSAQEEWSA